MEDGSASFADVSYWNDRYKQSSDTFEWHQPWEKVRDAIAGHVIYSGTAVVTGCGNSEMSRKLVDEGYSKVRSVDFSEVLIAQMSEKYDDEPQMDWVCQDCCKLDFHASGASAVFDKGTLDSMVTGSNATERVTEYMKCVERTLTLNGTFVIVSFAPPEVRKRYFACVSDKLVLKTVEQIPKPHVENTFYYVYVLKKRMPDLAEDE